MSTQIFVNLPVRNLDHSKKFFTGLGFSFNPQFTDSKAACLVISDDIYAMLLKHTFFKSFTDKQITDTAVSNEVILALSADSRIKVDEMMEKAIKAGGKEARQPQDLGFMYGRSFADPDGHLWEVFWMDPDHIQKNS